MSSFSHHSTFGTLTCNHNPSFPFHSRRSTTPVLWTPLPSFFPTPVSLFISISIPICSRISYLHKRTQNRKSSFDSITISSDHLISQLPSKIPWVAYAGVSTFSPVILSSTHSSWAAPHLMPPSLLLSSVKELELVNPVVSSVLILHDLSPPLDMVDSSFCRKTLLSSLLWSPPDSSHLPGESSPSLLLLFLCTTS